MHCPKSGDYLVRSEEFKEAVGKFPTGVAIISTANNGNLWGFTANSFVSVSLSPPLVSFCLDKESGSFEAFSRAEYFAVSILANDQADIAKHFAHKSSDKFLNIDHKIMDFSGTPLVVGAVCFIECRKYNQFECGDHFIFVGEVMKTTINDKKSPLLYFAKTYQEMQ